MTPVPERREFSIRPYQAADEGALYRICLETGDSGVDASALYADPQLLGHVYAAPYGRFEPELAFVLQDGTGPCGYVLGARDTQAFYERLRREWWPPLRLRYPLVPRPSGESTPDERLIRLIHQGLEEDADLTRQFPSHLHIDLLPRAQGGGHGKRLMHTLLSALREANSPGVHLGVGVRNTRAIGFYRHLGFEELAHRQGALMFGLKLH